MSRGRDPANARREGGKSPALVLERRWGWGWGELNPDLARNLSHRHVQSHQEPRSHTARSPPQASLAAGRFARHRRTQGARDLSGLQPPGMITHYPLSVTVRTPESTRKHTLLWLLTAANFVKLLTHPPPPPPAFLPGLLVLKQRKRRSSPSKPRSWDPV